MEERISKMQIKKSEMSGKLFKIDAINTNTLRNPYCIQQHDKQDDTIICTKCYSVDMLETFRKNCVPNFEHNSIVLSTMIHTDFSYLKFKSDIVRIHGHGELINQTHLHNICNMAFAFPNHTFALWSKRTDIVRKYFKNNPIPSNLILIYSNPKINRVITKIPYPFHKVFNNVDMTNELPLNENCTGQKCDDCRACYSLGSGVDIIIELEKSEQKKKKIPELIKKVA